MRVQPIQNLSYTQRHKLHCKQMHNVPQTIEHTTFKGVKGATAGVAIGAATALTVAALAGPFGLAVLPLWTTVGGIFGYVTEDMNKPNNEDAKKVKK